MQFLGAMRRRIAGLLSRRVASPAGGGTTSPASQHISPARAAWVEALSRERRARARHTRRARGTGMIVVSDRFPQSQFAGWNDGPRLTAWIDHPSAWRRAAARREREAFRLAELCPPDLVLKLHIPAELAARRKPETPREQIRTGVELLRRLSYPTTTRVIDVDATQPLGQVVLQVKRAVWDAI
jgi:thymidylate kinase